HPGRLSPALLQLAPSAVAHPREGMAIAFGGRVAGSGEGRKIYLWVRDEGSGIAREDQHRIFERFVRSGPEKSRERNSGLGLAIVRRIAQAHGGEVTVDSSPGRGATFTLVVPVREEG